MRINDLGYQLNEILIPKKLQWILHLKVRNYPAGSYMLKANSRKTRTKFEICSKLTYFTPCSSVYVVNSEQVNDGWVV